MTFLVPRWRYRFILPPRLHRETVNSWYNLVKFDEV